jgi:MFS family permease
MNNDTQQSPTSVRHLVIAALAGGTILAYLFRVCISPAGTTIQQNLTIDDIEMGGIYSAFFLGYFWFQIPGGWFGNKVGARAWLSILCLIWVAATFVTARADSADSIYYARVVLGLAQAGFFPVVIMAIREWFPAESRGFASSVITACMSVGAMIATAATTRLLKVFGWRDTFLIYAGLGVAWSLFFLIWYRNSPWQHQWVNDAEKKLISSNSEVVQEADSKSHIYISTYHAFIALSISPGMWFLCAQTFFQSFSYALFITWYPAYLEKGRGLSVTQAGDAATANLFMEVIGSILGGILIDRIFRKTGSKWKSRSLMPAMTLAVCSILTAAASFFIDPLPAIILVSAGMFFTGLGKTGKWACTIDLASGHTALCFAIMNMAGNVGAWLSPKVVGDMFKKLTENGGDWNQFLYLIAFIQLAGAACCYLLNPDKPAIGDGN